MGHFRVKQRQMAGSLCEGLPCFFLGSEDHDGRVRVTSVLDPSE